jgi:hypothetical protein
LVTPNALIKRYFLDGPMIASLFATGKSSWRLARFLSQGAAEFRVDDVERTAPPSPRKLCVRWGVVGDPGFSRANGRERTVGLARGLGQNKKSHAISALRIFNGPQGSRCNND